jgi:hypothetical protein
MCDPPDFGHLQLRFKTICTHLANTRNKKDDGKEANLHTAGFFTYSYVVVVVKEKKG